MTERRLERGMGRTGFDRGHGARCRTVYRAHRGTSLVEILVAMVILLLGIFALVRLFPTGFTSILYGRNVTAAQALTRDVVEYVRAHALELPDAVEAINPITRLPFPSLPVAEELTVFQPNPNMAPDTRFSDINKVRRIVGETTRIPAPTTSSPYMPLGGNGGQRVPISVYILQFGPIYAPVPTKSGLGGVTVYAGNALNRVELNGPPSDPQRAALDPFSYGIDYGNAMLYFHPANYARRFKMDYSFTVPAGPNLVAHAQAPPDTCIYLPANTNSYDLRQAHPNQPPDCIFYPLPAGTQLDPEKEFLYRGFDPLAIKQPFSSDDPYQFKILNPVIGVIGFNPLGATPGAGGTTASGITAKIDYDVDDWHIIHEDRVVPNAAPRVVNLTLNGIEPAGAVDEYQEPYTALMKDYADRPTPTPNIDLLVVDLESGLSIDSRTLQPTNNPNGIPGDSSNGQINYRDGSIQLNDPVRWTLPAGGPGPAESIGGKRLRIYYRTPQDWGVQLTKAATEYARVPGPTPGYREYFQGSDGYLFFPTQDHDQTVLVDYTWVQHSSVTDQDIVRTETGEYHQILDPTLPAGPPNPAQNWWIQVDGAQRADYVRGSIQVQRVRGVSVRSRAVWREGNRWRRLDLDSYVGRDQGT